MISTSRKLSQINEIKNIKYEKEVTKLKEEKYHLIQKDSNKEFILQQTKHGFKKRESGLHNFWRPKRDSSIFNNYKLHTRQNDNFIKLQ